MPHKTKGSGLFSSLIATIVCVLFAASASAQNIQISGSVKDQLSENVIGATVIVKGTTTGTSSDAKGSYKISAPKNAILVVSSLGYKTLEIPVGSRTVIDVILEDDHTLIEDIVVTGYGASARGDVTGAISSVSGKEIETFKTASVMEALGGQVAGVMITQVDGTPGAGFDIKVRGVGTVNGDASPLYVVDGFQTDNIDHLVNSDIQSIEVLKDASSAAIYGSRAANGVVLVTTKSGHEGRTVVSYNGSATFRQINKRLEVLSPYEFVRLQVELDPENSGKYYMPGNNEAGEAYRYQTLADYMNVGGVNWQDELFRTTWSQNHDVSVSGGTKDSRYVMSFSRFGEDGIVKSSDFNKTAAKVRLNQRIGKIFNLDLTVNYVNTKKQGTGTSADQGRFNLLSQVVRARPTGGLGLTDEQLLAEAVDPLELDEVVDLAQVNPLKQVENTTNTNVTDNWNANLSLKTSLAKNLTLTIGGSYSHKTDRADVFYNEGTSQVFRKRLSLWPLCYFQSGALGKFELFDV